MNDNHLTAMSLHYIISTRVAIPKCLDFNFREFLSSTQTSGLGSIKKCTPANMAGAQSPKLAFERKHYLRAAALPPTPETKQKSYSSNRGWLK